MAQLIKYRGDFNFAQESYVLYTYANCKDKAWINFCHQMARKMKRTFREMTCYFDGSVDNYRIVNVS